MGAPNDRLVTGEFPIQGEARAGDPGERMKPKRAKAHFMHEAYEVVASSCVCQLVDEDGVELLLVQQSPNSVGKRDMRAQNAVHCRRLLTPGKADRDAMGEELRPRGMNALNGPALRMAAVSPYP
jgi:hypothetical protein